MGGAQLRERRQRKPLLRRAAHRRKKRYTGSASASQEDGPSTSAQGTQISPASGLKPRGAVRRHVDRRLAPRNQVRNEPSGRRTAAKPHVTVAERVERIR